MVWLLVVLIPILLADIINPVLFTGIVYSLGSSHPFRNAWGVIISFFLTYFLIGIVLAFGIEWFEDVYFSDILDYIIEFFVACLVLYMAWSMSKKKNAHLEKNLEIPVHMNLKDALILGFQINLIGLPFAVPYLAAVDQVLKSNIHPLGMVSVLLLYNIVYLLPYVSLIVIRFFFKIQSTLIFKKINRWLDRVTENYLPKIIFILAILLFEDCLSYFLGYREWSFLSLF